MSNKQSNYDSKKFTFGDFLKTVIIALIVSILIIKFVVQRANVIGTSMYPTYHNGQVLFMDKISWKTFSNIHRFDIVVCTSESNPDLILIKRVIALPNEKITITEDGELYINDEQIDDKYAYYGDKENGLDEAIERVLGADEYFVCGDNRNASSDSRFESVGNIKKDKIRGRIIQF